MESLGPPGPRPRRSATASTKRCKSPLRAFARAMVMGIAFGLLMALSRLNITSGNAQRPVGTVTPITSEPTTVTRRSQTRRLRLSSNPFPRAVELSWLEGLQELPASHGPDSRDWTNSFALCATMKDENITDVVEWLTYYRWLGVDHIFLTDNNSEGGGALLEGLADMFSSTFLTLRTDTYEHAQLKTYAWCAEEHRHSFNWMAFLDMDEFLIVHSGQKIGEFMDAYKHEAGLSVHWVWVGPNGRTQRPRSGGVLPFYTLCEAAADRHVKTIANTFFLSGLEVHPHNFQFRSGRQSVDEDGAEVPMVWKGNMEFKTRHNGTDGACMRMRRPGHPDHNKLRKRCFETSGPMIEPPRAAKVALYHYATKSLADFTSKMSRGSGMSAATKGMEYFDQIARLQTDADWCLKPAQAGQACCRGLYPEAFSVRAGRHSGTLAAM